MSALSAFFRLTPGQGLKEYFEAKYLDLAAGIDWTAPSARLVSSLKAKVDEMPGAQRDQLVLDADRIKSLSDEAGRNALQAVANSDQSYGEIQSDWHRALMILLHHPQTFRLAEEVRHHDRHREGRMWSAFEIPAGTKLTRDAVSLASFQNAVRAMYDGRNVEVDIFERCRLDRSGKKRQLLQVALYRESAPVDTLEFVGDEAALQRRVVRPVIEVALTYEEETGAIEVVAAKLANREDLADAMVRHLLEAECPAQPVVPRRYDLSVLLRPFEFPTDPCDGIAEVVVNELRLVDTHQPGERLDLAVTRNARRNIWDMAKDRLSLNATSQRASGLPDAPAWSVRCAKFSIKFLPAGRSGSQRCLTFKISVPHGSTLRSMTERERLIGERYLARWGILKPVNARRV